jgi:hypothetical protein
MTDLTKLETLLMEEISGVDDPANQLPGWMVTKSRTQREGVLEAVENLRKACGGDDDLTIDVLAGRAIIWQGHKGETILKARHSTRGHGGKFVPPNPEVVAERTTAILFHPAKTAGEMLHPIPHGAS